MVVLAGLNKPFGPSQSPQPPRIRPDCRSLADHERVRLAEAANVEGRPIVSEDEFDDLCSTEMPLFLGLLEFVPTTLAGVIALVSHLNQIRESKPWKFEDNYATPLIGTLAAAFSRMVGKPCA